MVKIFGSEFSRFDSCTTAAEKKYGPYSVNIFELNPPITIPLGPIILEFRKCAVYKSVVFLYKSGVSLQECGVSLQEWCFFTRVVFLYKSVVFLFMDIGR